MKTATRSLWINLVLLLLAFTARAQTTTAISTLATATNAAGGDRILLNQASGSSYTTKQIAVSNLLNLGTVGLVVGGTATNTTFVSNGSDTATIQAALDLGGIVQLYPGSYTVSNLFLKSGNYLIGYGATLRMAAGASNAVLTVSSNVANVYIAGLSLDGGESATAWNTNPKGVTVPFVYPNMYPNLYSQPGMSNRTGLNIAMNSCGGIMDLDISGFSGYGVLLWNTNSSSLVYKRSMTDVRNLTVHNNYIGAWAAGWSFDVTGDGGQTYTGEYVPLSSIRAFNCFIGIGKGGGNLNFTGNKVTACYIGIFYNAANNPAHGVTIGNNINHSTYAIYGRGMSLGEIISKNVIIGGDLYFDNCGQLQVDGNRFGSSGTTTVTFTNSYSTSDLGYNHFVNNGYYGTWGSDLVINTNQTYATNIVYGNYSITKADTDRAPIVGDGSGITNLTGTFLAATNAAASNSYGTALWIGTNNAGIGTPWLLVSNGVAYFREIQSAYPGGNIGIGNAAQVASAGLQNVVIGSSALSKNTNGSYNVAIGSSTLQNATNVSATVSIGYYAHNNLQNGAGNTAVGYSAQSGLTTGENNTAVGKFAHVGLSTGSENTAIGAHSQWSAGIAVGNTSLGYNTLYSTAGGGADVGGYNTAVGDYAGHGITSGNWNLAIGVSALFIGAASSQNVVLGRHSLNRATNVFGVVAIGNFAGGSMTYSSADNNASLIDTNCTFLGTSSGRSSTIANTTPLTNAISLGYNSKALANNTCTIGGTGKEAVALILNPMESQPTNIVVGNPYIYSRTNSSVAELFSVGGDGVEHQISPHADDAPPQLYDRTSGDMKEMILRDSNPFITNGLVSFINLRRMARTMELHTRVLLLLGGVTNASTTAALTRLKAMTVAEKQVIATEDFPTYNARTGNTLQSLDWGTVQASVQAAYDLQRANVDLQRTYLTATNAVIQAQISAGDTNATLVALPDPLPVKNVQQPKPAWLK